VPEIACVCHEWPATGWSFDSALGDRRCRSSTFSGKRARLLQYGVAGEFLWTVVEQPRLLALLCSEHFGSVLVARVLTAAGGLEANERKIEYSVRS
jgi:hypothetical protein